MEVKIGVQNAARELVVETEDNTEAVRQQIADAVADGSVLTLTDAKGRTIIVPAAKLAYVEIGPRSMGHVGFRS